MLLHHLKNPKSPFLPSEFHLPLNHLLSFFYTLPLSQTPRCFSSESDQIYYPLILNSLHKVFFESRKHLQSLFLFRRTQFSGFVSQHNAFVFPSLFRSCVCLSQFGFGLGLHGHLIKLGFVNWVGIDVGLMKTYVKLGNKNYARQVFDEMPVKNEELCNSGICCFGTGGLYELVLYVFELMLESGFSPSLESICFASMACGELKRLDKGMWVHSFVRESKLDENVVIGNSLISMYTRIGRLDLARSAFDSMSNKDVVTWNSIITGYAQSRNSVEAFKIFQLMKEDQNVSPSMVTLLGLVSACGSNNSK